LLSLQLPGQRQLSPIDQALGEQLLFQGGFVEQRHHNPSFSRGYASLP
jgi:hypothetical protein